MKAYLQIDLNITDMELFLQYAQRIPDLIEKHAGRYLVQGVEPDAVQVDGSVPERSVVLEFPSSQAAQSFLAERESSDLHEIWAQSTTGRILLLDGCVE